jgi:DNA-binding NtrC family response regulator
MMNDVTFIGKILIVEDDLVNSEAMKDILEDVNYYVVLAHSAEDAKNMVSNQDFDLVMMDVWMPGQDGMSLLEEWMDSGFSPPVVMMSGHAAHKDVVRAIQMGAIDFLKKPLHDILPLVRKLLNKQSFNSMEQVISGIDFDVPLKTARNIFERQYFNHHLEENDHNIAKVAELAGLERTTLYRKLKDLGIDRK